MRMVNRHLPDKHNENKPKQKCRLGVRFIYNYLNRDALLMLQKNIEISDCEDGGVL